MGEQGSYFYWEPEAYISYDSGEGGGSILTHIQAEGEVTSTEEAYWYQSIGPIPSGEITVQGAFQKSWDEGFRGDINSATVRIQVEDGGLGWVKIWEHTSTFVGTDWTNFSGTYTVQNEVDNIRCRMRAEGWAGEWGIHESTTTINLWMDNISALGQIPASENVTIDPGSIRFNDHNIYYPDQTYVYEGGQVILEQEGSQMILESIHNMIDWERITEGKYKIGVKYPLVSGESSSVSSSGSGSVSLTRREDNNRSGLTENFTLFVETDYDNAWLEYFEEEVSEMPSGLARAGTNNGKPYLNVASGDNIIGYSITAENIEASL